MVKLYPSLISADLLDLRSQITLLDPYCDGYHLDVMDGHFVPNITWGPAFINTIAATTTKQCWVHLMTTNPQMWIDRFVLSPGSMVDFHIETDVDHQAILDHIRFKGWRCGITLSPNTSITTILPLLRHVDYVLVMSVQPGFSGQTFIPSSLETITALADYRAQQALKFDIAIDGGINELTIQQAVKAGATHIAAAAAIFSQHNPVTALECLKRLTFSI